MKPLSATAGEEEEETCGQDLTQCMRRTLVDGVAIIVAYSVIVYATEGKMLSTPAVLKFYGLFVALAFLFRFMNADMDQLTRVAGFQLGLKLFGVLG